LFLCLYDFVIFFYIKAIFIYEDGVENEKMSKDLLIKKHKEVFGEIPEIIVHSPGRVNLIGEHTDYNDGFVLPIAISMGIDLAISRIPDSEVISVYSMDKEKKIVSLYSDLMKSTDDWANYPIGVVKILQKNGFKFSGVRITFTGSIPEGAGLSSSAALEIAVAYAVQQIYNLKINDKDLIKYCQQAEQEVIGVRCGIMDQFTAKLGKAGNALFIDCRSLDHRYIPLKLKSAEFLITNSNVSHKLSTSKYNERVFECEEAVKVLNEVKPGKALRDFTKDDYEKAREFFPPEERKRAFHVISENNRVIEGEKALKQGDLKKFGQLMNDSHESLKLYYEVSCAELDWLVETAQKIEGCYGSRMIGAGFGGSTVTLIEKKAIPDYLEELKEYKEKFGLSAITYEVTPSDGVHKI